MIEWEDEGEEDEEARIELSLIGKVWTDRIINVNAFINTMSNVWNPRHGVEISNTAKNTYMFQFHHSIDKQRVLDEQPWHFDRHAVIFSEVDPAVKPSENLMYELPMWARIYNLPVKGRLNMANVEKLGNKIGKFVKMDNSGSLGINKSIRLGVKVDVKKPLLKAVKLKLGGWRRCLMLNMRGLPYTVTFVEGWDMA